MYNLQETPSDMSADLAEENKKYEWKIIWYRVAAFIYIHIVAIHGIQLLVTGRAKLLTFLFGK